MPWGLGVTQDMLYSLYSLLVASSLHAFALAPPISGSLWLPLESARDLMCDEPKKGTILLGSFPDDYWPSLYLQE